MLILICSVNVATAQTAPTPTYSGNASQIQINRGSSWNWRLFYLPRTFNKFTGYDTMSAVWFDSASTRRMFYHNGSLRLQVADKAYVDSIAASIVDGGGLTDTASAIRRYVDSADSVLEVQITTLQSDVTSVDSAVGVAFGAISDIYDSLGDFVPYTNATTNVNLGEYWLRGGAFVFDTTPMITPVNGTMYWDATHVTPRVQLNSSVTMEMGQELLVRARNNTGVEINDGQVVYINDAQGNNPTIALANADSISTSDVIGMATENIPQNGTGFVTAFGNVNGINTSGYNNGDALYLSATPGQLTNAIPSPPHNVVYVGKALNSTNNGRIFVSPARPLAQDTTMAWNSNRVAPTQRSVKTYVDNKFAAAGTVTSVSGTSGRISSTGGTTPVLDLVTVNATPATYGGNNAIPVVAVDAYGRATSITTVAPVTTTTITTTNFTPSYTIAATDSRPILLTITALANDLTFNAPTGLTDGQLVLIRIKATGSSRALTWNGAFGAIAGPTAVALPTTVTTTAFATMQFIFNSTDNKLYLSGYVTN